MSSCSSLLSALFHPPFPKGKGKESWKKEFIELVKSPNITIKNGVITRLKYKNMDNQTHRNSYTGPAIINYSKNGEVFIVKYKFNGKLHRLPELGPAVIDYYKTGKILSEQYYFKGKLHRSPESGFAEIWYYENGEISYKQHWVYGKRVNQRK